MYCEIQQPDRAVAYLKQGVAVADAVDEKSALVEAHLRLAEVYEQQADYALALAHLKQHNALRERIPGEKATMRLRVLQVAHDTATARKEVRSYG